MDSLLFSTTGPDLSVSHDERQMLLPCSDSLELASEALSGGANPTVPL